MGGEQPGDWAAGTCSSWGRGSPEPPFSHLPATKFWGGPGGGSGRLAGSQWASPLQPLPAPLQGLGGRAADPPGAGHGWGRGTVRRGGPGTPLPLGLRLLEGLPQVALGMGGRGQAGCGLLPRKAPRGPRPGLLGWLASPCRLGPGGSCRCHKCLVRTEPGFAPTCLFCSPKCVSPVHPPHLLASGSWVPAPWSLCPSLPGRPRPVLPLTAWQLWSWVLLLPLCLCPSSPTSVLQAHAAPFWPLCLTRPGCGPAGTLVPGTSASGSCLASPGLRGPVEAPLRHCPDPRTGPPRGRRTDGLHCLLRPCLGCHPGQVPVRGQCGPGDGGGALCPTRRTSQRSCLQFWHWATLASWAPPAPSVEAPPPPAVGASLPAVRGGDMEAAPWVMGSSPGWGWTLGPRH